MPLCRAMQNFALIPGCPASARFPRWWPRAVSRLDRTRFPQTATEPDAGLPILCEHLFFRFHVTLRTNKKIPVGWSHRDGIGTVYRTTGHDFGCSGAGAGAGASFAGSALGSSLAGSALGSSLAGSALGSSLAGSGAASSLAGS